MTEPYIGFQDVGLKDSQKDLDSLYVFSSFERNLYLENRLEDSEEEGWSEVCRRLEDEWEVDGVKQ